MTEDLIAPPLEKYSDTVLYDVFFESGTILGGWLVALERKAEAAGDLELAKRWQSERLLLAVERRAVEADDRACQIACKRKWDARRVELDALFDEVPECVAVTA